MLPKDKNQRLPVGRGISFVQKFLPLLGLILLVSQHSFAASFDCGKASTKVERMICMNPKLGESDQDLNDQYTRLILASEPLKVAAIKTAQRQWLKERGKCSDQICVQKVYQKRVRELYAQLKKLRIYSAFNDEKEVVDEILFSKFPSLRVLAKDAKPPPEDDAAWGVEFFIWERNPLYLVLRLSSWSHYKDAASMSADEEFVTLHMKEGTIVTENLLKSTHDFSISNESLIRAAYLKHFESRIGGCADLAKEEAMNITTTVPSRLGLGLMKSTSQVDAACAGPFFITWSKVEQYLSETGLKVMKDFMN